MNIQFISHASVLIKTPGSVIWTDPWLQGKAFNESWALYPPAAFSDELLPTITHIWISHEHPDHFHLPTLRALPADFKERVTVLFQKNNSKKMFDALRKIGFKTFIELPQRKMVPLDPATSLYCYQVGNMDSALGVVADDTVLLNINDAEVNEKDCRTMLGDLGKVDIVLNQFSIAGYSGQEDRDAFLPKQAKGILDNVVSNHRDLNARFTIPFASMVYFCRDDNTYINTYANTVDDVYGRLNAEGLRCIVLYPGESWNPSTAHDNDASLLRYRKARDEFDTAATILPNEPLPLEKIEQAYRDKYRHIQSRYWKIFRLALKPVTVHIPDLQCNVTFSLRDEYFHRQPASQDFDLAINSQPLWMIFAMPFGCQTLGVSARYTLRRNMRNWKFHRVLFAMDNAEVYLSLAFFNRSNMAWIKQRAAGLVNQLAYQIKRM